MRTRGGVAQQRLMTPMQAVERTDADHASFGAQGPAFSVAKQEIHEDRQYSGPA